MKEVISFLRRRRNNEMLTNIKINIPTEPFDRALRTGGLGTSSNWDAYSF
jgi:hypothetical protein